MNEKQITVSTTIAAPMEKVWKYFTEPEHIVKWSHASDDWHSPHAENNLHIGGKFMTRMEAKDGSAGFDFTGTYDNVIPQRLIAYTMDGNDARKVEVSFALAGDDVQVTTTFDPENENPLDMQRAGWQAILDNFKKEVEG